MELSFSFAVFSVHISHPSIEQLGSFAIFCMRCFHSGLSVEDISQLTCLKTSVIEEQLLFAQERGYISNDGALTEKGRRVIEVLDLLETRLGKLFFAVDLYSDEISIDDIYPMSVLESLPGKDINHLPPAIKPLRILKRMMQLKSDSHMRELLKKILPQHEKNLLETIDTSILDELEFDFRYEGEKKITLNANLSDLFTIEERDDLLTYINFKIPTLYIRVTYQVNNEIKCDIYAIDPIKAELIVFFDAKVENSQLDAQNIEFKVSNISDSDTDIFLRVMNDFIKNYLPFYNFKILRKVEFETGFFEKRLPIRSISNFLKRSLLEIK